MNLSLVVFAILIFTLIAKLISAIIELNREVQVLGVEMINDLDNTNKTLEIMFNSKRN